MSTFKEFMHESHPELDKVALKAETTRTQDEDAKYERRTNMRTFKAETMTTPATDNQIRAIISMNTQYKFIGVKYPDTQFFSKAHAIIILNTLNELKADAAKRDFDRDLYYRLYDRFAARYPENHMTVPVRDYRTSGEDIPESLEDLAKQPTWSEKQAQVRHDIEQEHFMNMVYNAFIKVN